MERLVREGVLSAVLDVTTTEIADHLVGGVMSAGPERLSAPLEAGIPYVVSVGATDMVNFGPKATVPDRFQTRKLYEHNPSVTLMRTTPEECAQLGKTIAGKLRNAGAKADRTEVWIPCGGVSALSVDGAAFEDREADEALFRAVEEGLDDGGEAIRVVRKDEDVNNPAFVEDVVGSLVRMMGLRPVSSK